MKDKYLAGTQMKKTYAERFRSTLLKFGRKNIVLRYLVLPVLALGLFFFHLISYLQNNTKRLSLCCLSMLVFVMYSSFSFPLFISGDSKENTLLLSDEGQQTVYLAYEKDIDIEDIELLDDEDVMEEDDNLAISHGLTVDKYHVDEILEAYGNLENIDTPTEEDMSIAEAKEDTSYLNEDEAYWEDYVFDKDDWRLVLINKQHSIPDEYSFTLGTVKTIKGDMECDERIIDDWIAMLQAAKESEISLMICSPYRDMERQIMLFNRKINRYVAQGMSYMEAYKLSSEVVTVPGASEHQIGLALDIVCSTYDSLDEGFGETDAGIWLAENSYRYGFILRYPQGKEYITGIDYEPWHFRYVGVEAATYITKKGITLEEFWEELK